MSATVDLTGRRVLVTGASSGIGAATSRALVGAGASVALLARRKERLDELCEELGAGAVGVPADVTDLAALESAIAEAARALGGLDGLVAVAGKTLAGSVLTGSPEAWRDLMNVNLIGPLATIRYAYRHFASTGRRDIVVVGSAGSITPMPGTAIYGASKRGLKAACDSLRLELAPAGVNVSVVLPGMFETEGLTLEGMVIDGDVPPSDFPLFAGEATIPQPQAIADSIAFLMSLPEGVAINELVARPTGQLNP